MPDYQAIQVQSQSQDESLCYVPSHHESIITRPGAQGETFVAMRYFNDKQQVRTGLVLVSTLDSGNLAEAQTQCSQLAMQLAQQYRSQPQGMRQILQRKNLTNVAVSTLFRQKNGAYQAFFCLQGEQAIIVLNKDTGVLKYQFTTEKQSTRIKRFQAEVQANDLIIHLHRDAWAQTKAWFTSDNSPQIQATSDNAGVYEVGLALSATFESISQSNLIAIMAVPYYAYELVRTYVERPELRVKLIRKIQDEQIPSAQINQYLEQLQSERLAALPMRIDAIDQDSFSLPYSTSNTPFMQNVLDLQQLAEAGNALDKKKKLAEAVAYFKDLDIHAMSNYFDALLLYDDIYNTHKNPQLDRFFGIHQTSSWSISIKKIRTQALANLFEKVEALDTPAEKINLLTWAKGQALFKLHRSNSVFTGAFGNTASINYIEKKIHEIQAPATASSNQNKGTKF